MTTGQLASVLAALGFSACVQSTTEPCDGGMICRESTQCHSIVEPALVTCVTQEQLDVCSGAEDRTSCTYNEDPGTCLGGACYPAECGDSIVDLTEACDEGDRIDGDGCSANCMSRELCGDDLIDLSLAEQCDDGTVGISGDGCSSRCLKEYDLWSERSPGSPGVRVDQAFARAPGGGVMIFGGTPGVGNSNPIAALGDAWRWDGMNWSEVISATPPPAARAGAAAAYEPARRQFLLFGGRGVGGEALDDLWRWDGVAWTALTASGARPSGRWNASMACSATRCVLHGGRTAAGMLGDTWIWNGSWTELAGTAPPARSRGALVNTAGDVFVLFGGIDSVGPRSDTWELAAQWQAKTTSLSNPPASVHPAAAFDAATAAVILVSGNATWSFKNSTWTNTGYFYPATVQALAHDAERGRVVSVSEARTPHEWNPTGWGGALNNAKPQAPRLAMLATYLPHRGRTLVVEPSGTWEWDTRSWRRVPLPSAQPSPLGAGLVFDTACNQAVLFGGAATWTYDGAWAQLSVPNGAPGARSFHAMTYDAKRKVVVVFGGVDAGQLLGDVWELRGPCTARMWTQVPSTSGPSARRSARLAFDAARRVSVLFGGNDGDELDDTWEWDGTSWTPRTMGAKPPARSEHSMVYNARRRAVVMFGGGFDTAFLSDSWQWNGAEWTKLLPIISPAGRRGMTMATDVAGALVIFGGESEAASQITDVWRLAAETNFEPVERCVVGGVDEDGDTLETCDDPDCAARCVPTCSVGETCSGPRCGDGTCSFVEDYVLCPADCTPP